MNIEWSFSEGGNSAKCQQNINSYRRKCMALEKTDTLWQAIQIQVTKWTVLFFSNVELELLPFHVSPSPEGFTNNVLQIIAELLGLSEIKECF